MDSPCLPPELEREIVETTACVHPETIPVLLLVARRICEWIERIRYRTITTDGESWTLPFNSLLLVIRSNVRPPDFFRDRVQHLFAGHIVSNNLPEVLSVCTEIQSLIIFRSDPMTLLRSLRPRRLYVNIRHLLTDLESPHLYPAFSLLTHLDVLDTFTSPHPSKHTLDSVITELALFPALTHLAMCECIANAPDILARCTRLVLLVDQHCSEPKSRHPLTHDDVRFVSIVLSDQEYIPDWVLGVRGGRDFWARGDMFVAKKRRGEIKPSSRYWIEDGDGI
ncbi:hypothetical protein C8R46DRAFT_1126874 [Mycena filopes]|nr:hypothetical protein C8R46DRAFT_1126874 [Mycena filopes]